jgi:hypothetical protein
MPYLNQRALLVYPCVLIECLNEEKQPIPDATASGFIRKEGEDHFLYTCWHVVTAFDPYRAGLPKGLPTRRHYLRVHLQAANRPSAGVTVVGGLQTLELPLYDVQSGVSQPMWLQDEQERPHLELNALGFRVPFWHDAVKIPLPTSLQISEFQFVDNDRIFGAKGAAIVFPGDKTIVVGYPYGFSSVGQGQPTPVALTRFVAGTAIADRKRQFLLESIGGAGMSGGPVYIDTGTEILLIGVYTGLIYPDYFRAQPDKTTALGTVADLTTHLLGHLPFARPTVPTDAG